MEGINLASHHALTSSIGVKEICDPILKSIGITYFNYIKIYNNDCSRDLLTNNADWINHFYQNSLFNSAGTVDIEHLLPKGYFLWSEMDNKDPIYLQGRDYFNIDNGITFVIKREDITYLYIFASSKEQYQINNFYLGNIDLLQRFIHYFTDKGQSLINEAQKNRIYLPSLQPVNTNRVNNIEISEEIRKEFFDATQINRYFLLNESDTLYLTNKQAECASLLTKGMTSKLIAKHMDISFRTVERYILDIRQKIQAQIDAPLTKDKLIQILRYSNIR